jgi:uncharacterized protein YxjI
MELCGVPSTARQHSVQRRHHPLRDDQVSHTLSGRKHAEARSRDGRRSPLSPRKENRMLNRKTYFVRERVGFMKLVDTFDIFDPETQTQLGIAKEKPGMLVQLLRLMVNKRMLPTKVCIYEGTNPDDESRLLFTIRRGITLLRSKVDICDGQGNVVGWFKSKLLSIGGAFYVFDASGNQVAYVKGDWKGWNFRFLDSSDKEIGTISKKWAGIGKEFFTSADNYVIALHEEPSPAKAILLLAAGLAVDTVFKEK